MNEPTNLATWADDRALPDERNGHSWLLLLLLSHFIDFSQRQDKIFDVGCGYARASLVALEVFLHAHSQISGLLACLAVNVVRVPLVRRLGSTAAQAVTTACVDESRSEVPANGGCCSNKKR